MGAFYRQVYPKSWKTIRSNFHILFFGLFASILGFQELKILFNLSDTQQDFLSSTISGLFDIFIAFSGGVRDFSAFLTLVGLFIVFAFVLVLTIASQGAIIHISGKKKKKQTRDDFMDALRMGADKFWPLFGINVINALIGYFFVAFIISPLIVFVAGESGSQAISALTGIATFFILVPLVVIISFVTRYGAAYIILRDQGMIEAFINGWNLFRANWLITIENAIFLMILTTIYFLLLVTAMVFAFTPFLILAYFIGIFDILFYIIVLIGALVGVAIFVLASSFFGAYYNLVWAFTWEHLTARNVSHSKIHRLTAKHVPQLHN